MPAAPTETEVLERGTALLQESLPPGWQVQRPPDDPLNDGLADAVVNLSSPAESVRVLIEVKQNVTPRDVAAIVRDASLLSRVAGDVLVLAMAPWLSDRSQALLTEAGVNYLDLSGDVRLVSERPPLFIHRQTNAPAPRWRQSTPSLRGRKAGRVVRLLADVQPPYGVLELARYAAVTPGYVSRLLDTLESENVVERTRRGGVARVDWRELLLQRAASYDVFSSNAIERFVCPNGPAFALDVARNLRLPGLALSGSFAAEEIVSLAPPALLLLYAESEPRGLVRAAGLLPAEAGANVVIASPYDSVVFDRPRRLVPTLPTVAASQMALDCLTGNGRMPQEGEALLAWMGEDTRRWRLPSLASVSAPEQIH